VYVTSTTGSSAARKAGQQLPARQRDASGEARRQRPDHRPPQADRCREISPARSHRRLAPWRPAVEPGSGQIRGPPPEETASGRSDLALPVLQALLEFGGSSRRAELAAEGAVLLIGARRPHRERLSEAQVSSLSWTDLAQQLLLLRGLRRRNSFWSAPPSSVVASAVTDARCSMKGHLAGGQHEQVNCRPADHPPGSGTASAESGLRPLSIPAPENAPVAHSPRGQTPQPSSSDVTAAHGSGLALASHAQVEEGRTGSTEKNRKNQPIIAEGASSCPSPSRVFIHQ